MKNIILPKIKKGSLYEAVIVEFREFPHIEFIIRNTILKLGNNWSHTIICGNQNFKMVEQICDSISPNIKIIKLNVNNLTQNEYSLFLMKSDFWNLLKGEKIFIYQEDSLVFKNNIDDFLEHDFIGAPFSKQADDTPNSVGNGGLSLRTKKIMLDIIAKFPYNSVQMNSNTLMYMKNNNLTYPPEDVYFSKCMQENCIGYVADWNTASLFSSESIYNENSMGGHKFWISNPNWQKYLKNIFKLAPYTGKSNLNKYLKYLNKPESFNRNKENPNAFDIDFYFFCKANNLDYNQSNNCAYFKSIGMNGFIYHPKQIKNYFSNACFYTFMDNIYITSKLIPEPMTIQNFTNQYLYNATFDFYASLLIKKISGCLNNNFDILFLVFIGNEEIGVNLLNYIIEHKKINQDFNISFCFNSEKILKSKTLIKLIKSNFDFYAIYICKDMGTDITPTILMYNDICKTHSFMNIYKFHTKSIVKNYKDLTSYLLDKSLNTLLNEQTANCNCIGNPLYYLNIANDTFNNKLKNQYVNHIYIEKGFVSGTIFYTSNIIMNKVLDFIKNNNYRSFFLNNLYENNSINIDNSPIHFLERLFGVIK